MGARGVTEPTTKLSGEMRIVAKAGGLRYFAELLTCPDRCPAFQQVRRVIQTNGIYQFAAGTAARR
jgi:hypothetical protein